MTKHQVEMLAVAELVRRLLRVRWIWSGVKLTDYISFDSGALSVRYRGPTVQNAPRASARIYWDGTLLGVYRPDVKHYGLSQVPEHGLDIRELNDEHPIAHFRAAKAYLENLLILDDLAAV